MCMYMPSRSLYLLVTLLFTVPNVIIVDVNLFLFVFYNSCTLYDCHCNITALFMYLVCLVLIDYWYTTIKPPDVNCKYCI